MAERLFIGNWKMNMRPAEAAAFFATFMEHYVAATDGCDVGIAPPFTSLSTVRDNIKNTPSILLGAQNVHWLESGAHTGEISPLMLVDAGVSLVIVGHSERRQFYGESDNDVSLRARSALKAGLRPVICIGESLSSFEAGASLSVVEQQLRDSLHGITVEESASMVIAYEPVWAIGTGRSATPEIITGIHKAIRSRLVSNYGENGAVVPILYGGSTTPDNIKGIMSCSEVNGALVGGASLKPDVFWQLISEGRKGAP